MFHMNRNNLAKFKKKRWSSNQPNKQHVTNRNWLLWWKRKRLTNLASTGLDKEHDLIIGEWNYPKISYEPEHH
jgi:hypothetical protein